MPNSDILSGEPIGEGGGKGGGGVGGVTVRTPKFYVL